MKWIVGVLVVAGILIGIGNLTADKPVEYRERVVHEPGKTKIVTVTNDHSYMPESCKTAIALADRRVKAANILDNETTAQLGLISDARRELASTNKLNDTDTALRQLQARTLAAVLEMSNTDKPYAEAYASCLKETNR